MAYFLTIDFQYDLFQDNVIKKMEAISLCIQFWCICSVLTKCFKSLNVALDRLRIRKNQGKYIRKINSV